VYQLLVYLHVLGAVIWVGGAVAIQVLAIRFSRSADPAELARFAPHMEFLGSRLFGPAAVVILVTGLIMTVQAWSFDQLWIAVALVLWILSAVSGAVYLGPRARRAAALVEAEGPSSVEGRVIFNRLALVSRLELVSFFVIIALMVVKPGS
jgi:uncharacterized membrane protein